MEDKYVLTIKCENEEEARDYINAMKYKSALWDIYNTARNYDKHLEATSDNYYKMCDEIRELSFLED
jgi:hypothetical protein